MNHILGVDMSQSMETMVIQADTDHFRRVAKATPEKAIAELVWNAFDGDADNIHVNLKLDIADSQLTVSDDGTGIDLETARKHFARVGGSWKRTKKKTAKNRTIHGEKGEGRLKAFSLGHSIVWHTTYREGDRLFNFEIHADSGNIGVVNFTDKVEVTGVDTGTQVVVSNLTDAVMKDPSKQLVNNGLDRWVNTISNKLTLMFAPVLLTYPQITITVNGVELEPGVHLMNEPETVEIKDAEGNILGTFKILLWNDIQASNVYLCKQDGAVLEEYESKATEIKSFGYKYSAYIQSSLLTEDTVALVDMDESITFLVSESIQVLNEKFKTMKDAEKANRIGRWIDDGIYPYDQKSPD